jgi:hypothetical protein
MTQGIASTPRCTSVPCSPSRIAKGFALRRNEADSCCADPQRIQHHHAFARHRQEIAVRSACQLAAFNSALRQQTP